MKVSIESHIRLTLTQNEAAWLKGVMQNPLYGQHPKEEDLDERELRRALFDALNNIAIPPGDE